ncbi:MAG: hypothetical protein P8J87_17700, partial [Verrucomicrobiales bacterium]|nr:hypothetical protein [Verrucomicrobiales bacterium]
MEIGESFQALLDGAFSDPGQAVDGALLAAAVGAGFSGVLLRPDGLVPVFEEAGIEVYRSADISGEKTSRGREGVREGLTRLSAPFAGMEGGIRATAKVIGV